MADISHVKGDQNLPEPPDKRKRKEPKPFKRVEKVQKTDPDEQKKRKMPQEAFEEAKAQQEVSQPPTQEGVSEPSPYEPPSSPPPQGVPETTTTPSPTPYTPPPVEDTPSISEPPASQQPQQPQRSHKKKRAAPTKKEASPKKVAKKKATPPSAKPETTRVEKHAQPEPVKKPEETPQPPPAPPELPKGSWEKTKKIEEESHEVTEKPPAPLPAQEAPQPVTPSAEPPPVPAASITFANIPPQMLALFERTLGVMSVMHETGVKETTIHLTNPQFAKSIFFGAEIVISEYSTAPKEFNIQLLGNQQQTQLMTANASELVAAFQASQYNFKVHRLDIGALESAKLEKKEKARKVTRKKGAS